ncbi:MAG TPA: TetR/AcrR family transcriptional regulator [Myxococcaceae bacterium]|jgi:AcrR family transcriptional regulator
MKRRDALLDAALRCFMERGVLGTGIEDIRRAAGASPSSVYHLFDGLPGLTLALLTRTFERLFAHLAERVTAARTAEASVVALVDGHLEWILSHPDEGRFMYQAMSLELGADAAETLQARKAELLLPIVLHMGRFITEGTLPPWPPLLLDVVLLGPSHEACRRFLAGAPIDPQWMRTTLPQLAWQSVKPRRQRGKPVMR